MTKISPQQLKALHAALHMKGLLKHKAEMIGGITNGRSESSKDLTAEEARDLLISLNNFQAKEKTPTPGEQDASRMIKKLFAMAHEMGWIKPLTFVNDSGAVVSKNDNSRIYGWVLKYGYLKKELRKYSYSELPKLISAFEFNIYMPYIANRKKQLP